MRIPVLSPVWDRVSDAAWDVALNSFEMVSLGWRAWWWQLHFSAARQFLFDPPGKVVRREAPALGLPEGQCVFGETPVISMIAMLRRVGITADDVVFDLGCGRALALMGAARHFGVKGVGIEVVPTLVARARRMAGDLDLSGKVTLIEGDFLKQDLSPGTIFYAASTTYSTRLMRRLAARIARSVNAERPIRAITLSQPLGRPFRTLEKLRFPMTWGWVTTYFQELHYAE
ncbi:MAG: hypothetical protein FJX76_09635 [Armatimonadetes bacterium]|nr:hypothetical protein [Armatimonadota bacterium]